MVTPAEIARGLECYLRPAEAARRALAVCEDMALIGFPLEISREVPAAQWIGLGARPQAEYVLPVTKFDINAENGDQAMAGSSLTRGNLLRLSQAVDLGRRWLPGSWPRDFAGQLLGAEHLDTINELWWLKFWRGLVAVQRGPKENAADVDFDWLLTIRDGLADCTVNFEVKRRTGNLNAWFKFGNPSLSCAKIAKKFGPNGADAANLVALTVFRPPGPEAMRFAMDWLAEQEAVDGLLVWTEHNLGRAHLLKLVKPAKKWAEFLVAAPEPEDFLVAGYAVGTLCQPDEAPAFLEQYVRHLQRQFPE